MTSTGELIRARLIAATSVTDLVGQRIYANRAPQGAAFPFVVYQEVSDVPANKLAGTPTLKAVRLQVDSYADSYLEAHEVAEAVDAVLAALALPGLSVVRLGARDFFDVEAQKDRVSADFSVWRRPSST